MYLPESRQYLGAPHLLFHGPLAITRIHERCASRLSSSHAMARQAGTVSTSGVRKDERTVQSTRYQKSCLLVRVWPVRFVSDRMCDVYV